MATQPRPQPPPLVWLPACHRQLDLSDPGGYSVLHDRYAQALRLEGLQPALFALSEPADVAGLLEIVDGVLLTGSPSNVHASRYGAQPLATDLLDEHRDALTHALIHDALARSVPLFAICRGLQELNVALGGSLHQRVHETPGLHEHREPPDAPLEQQFALVHEVRLAPGSAFERWAGARVTSVNSLHGQGIRQLAPGLVAEAFAPDGLVEAVHVADSRSFAYGVQWHPEWQHRATPIYAGAFVEFANACRQRQAQRRVDSTASATCVNPAPRSAGVT